MPSVWVRTCVTKDGKRRYIVGYRVGGRETKTRHGGSFGTKQHATIRAQWIGGELAARRVPDLSALVVDAPKTPTLGAAGDAWRASRVDVAEQTKKQHHSDLARVFAVAPRLRDRRVDELTHEDVADVIAALVKAKKKRGTIKKSRDALAMVLDFCGVEPNPARDKRVKLPKERRPHVPPPLAEHVERVAEVLPRHHVLPLLIIDECGPRVNELATAQVGDLDEHRKAIRVRSEVEKNERYRLLELPDDLFDALLATLPPREDRSLKELLFPDLNDAALRTAITKACKATGTPHFSPARPPSSTRVALLQAHRLAR